MSCIIAVNLINDVSASDFKKNRLNQLTKFVFLKLSAELHLHLQSLYNSTNLTLNT